MHENPLRREAASCCGLVVTYQPDERVKENLRAVIRECGRVIVVDNGSEATWRDSVRSWAGVELIANGRNLGLAAALNQGARRAVEWHCAWIIAFDQDSRPGPGFRQALFGTLAAHPESGRVAVVGSNVREMGAGGRNHRWLRPHPWLPGAFARVRARGHDLPSVTRVITSGSLLRVAAFNEVGPFDEDLFVDFVDTDFCLRCRRRGHLIAVSAAAGLEHAYGHREVRRWLGFAVHPTNHPALRHYYIARNRVPMMRRHAWREPHWFFFDCGAALLWFFRVLAVEDHKGKKVLAMLLGTWDGLRGRLGACPEDRRCQLGS